MNEEKKQDETEIDPTEATTEADVSDGAEQKQPPVDLPSIDEVR